MAVLIFAGRVGQIPKHTDVATDLRTIIDKVDAAIIALPHNLNAGFSRELLNAGTSILVEKSEAFTADRRRWGQSSPSWSHFQ
jgi:predicted dehydrogenase